MRAWIGWMSLTMSVAVFADGDPKSLAAAPPPPPVVEATPVAPPAPIAEAPPAPVVAEVPGPVVAAPVRAEGFGADTRYWVASQISGAQSVKELRPIPGDVAQHTYARYLKSFDYPIPETFKRDSFNTGGGGGGGSSSSTR